MFVKWYTSIFGKIDEFITEFKEENRFITELVIRMKENAFFM